MRCHCLFFYKIISRRSLDRILIDRAIGAILSSHWVVKHLQLMLFKSDRFPIYILAAILLPHPRFRASPISPVLPIALICFLTWASSVHNTMSLSNELETSLIDIRPQKMHKLNRRWRSSVIVVYHMNRRNICPLQITLRPSHTGHRNIVGS